MRGRTDKGFLKSLNLEFMSLVGCALCWALKSWCTGSYVEIGRFRGQEAEGSRSPPRYQDVANSRRHHGSSDLGTPEAYVAELAR